MYDFGWGEARCAGAPNRGRYAHGFVLQSGFGIALAPAALIESTNPAGMPRMSFRMSITLIAASNQRGLPNADSALATTIRTVDVRFPFGEETLE